MGLNCPQHCLSVVINVHLTNLMQKDICLIVLQILRSLLHWIEYVPPHPCPTPHSIWISWTGKQNLIWNNSLCRHNKVKLSRWAHPGISLRAFTPKSRKVCIRNQRGSHTEKSVPCEGRSGKDTGKLATPRRQKKHGKLLKPSGKALDSRWLLRVTWDEMLWRAQQSKGPPSYIHAEVISNLTSIWSLW